MPHKARMRDQSAVPYWALDPFCCFICKLCSALEVFSVREISWLVWVFLSEWLTSKHFIPKIFLIDKMSAKKPLSHTKAHTSGCWHFGGFGHHHIEHWIFGRKWLLKIVLMTTGLAKSKYILISEVPLKLSLLLLKLLLLLLLRSSIAIAIA